MNTRISRLSMPDAAVVVAALEDEIRINKDLVGMLILIVVIVVLLLTNGSVGG